MTRLQWYRVAAGDHVRVASLGLACCALEVESAIRAGLLVPETDEHAPAAEAVLLVTGTVTAPIADLLEAVRADADGESVRLLAFGACASTGGPYWDAPSVVPGADRLLPVQGYVPGCPPRPEALVDALLAGQVPA